MANGIGALTLADMLRQGVPQDALLKRQAGLADALRTAPARRPPKPAQPYPREWFDLPADQLPDEAVADDFFTDSYLTYNAPTQAQQRAARVNTPYPRELFEMSPENIPEEYLTDPTFAASYHAYKGTRPTPSQPDALLQASPEQIPEEYLSNPAFAQAYHAASKTQPTQPREPAAQRPWFADMPLEQIPEEMLSDPDFAAAYNAWHGTEATEPTELDDDEDDAEPLMVQGGAETRAPGVYPVEGEPGMVDVVLGGGAGGRMTEDEFYASPELTAAVREAMAPQREAEEVAALPVAPGESEAVATAPGETTVYLPPEAEEPAGEVEVAVGEPQNLRRVPREAPAAPMTPAQQKAALDAVRSGREATRAVAEAPVLQREEPAAVANGKGNGAASQVADLVKTAAPAVQQAMADNLITPEGLRLLTTLTRDPTLMRIGEIVAGEAASERQLKSKEALAKQTAADKAAAAKDLAEYRKGMLGAAEKRASAALINARKPRAGAVIIGPGGVSKDVARMEAQLRGELLRNPTAKDAIVVGDAWGKVQAAAQNPSAAGDLSLIFGYMKLLDPTSVVREGEQATAANARGVPEAIRAQWNRVLSGERLAPTQRQDFVSQARSLYGSQQQRLGGLVDAYREQAERYGLSADRIVSPVLRDLPQSAGQPAGRVRIRDTKTGRTGWASEGEKLPPGVEVVR